MMGSTTGRKNLSGAMSLALGACTNIRKSTYRRQTRLVSGEMRAGCRELTVAAFWLEESSAAEPFRVNSSLVNLSEYGLSMCRHCVSIIRAFS